MSFSRYPKYKDSGVEWLGQVPAHWSIRPLKAIGNFKGGAGFPHDQQGVAGEELAFYKVNALSGANAQGVLAHSENTVSRETAARLGAFIFPSGSIVFAKVGAALLLGRIRILGAPACIDNNMLGLIVDHFSRDFVVYGMHLVRFDLLANPGAVPSLNEGQIGAFVLPLPPATEQTAIAAFLDRETGKIDALVAEQEKLIALLKEKRQAVISHAVTKGLNPDAPMKPSGIEWLGDVPAHWEVIRIGTAFREASDLGNVSLPILSVSIHDGVSDKELDESEMDRKVTRSEDRSIYKAVRPGDLAYNMMRAWQGGFGAVAVDGQVSPAYVVARPIRCIRTAFVEQIFRTPQAIEQMRRHSRGITDFRLRLYWEEFKNVRIALPPIEEQDSILASVAGETNKFDTLTTTALRSIDLLKERRSALISAAVTGQIDVRDAASAVEFGPPRLRDGLLRPVNLC